MTELKPAGAACLTCPLRDEPCVLPEPARVPRLMVVGEAPGRNEVRRMRPFVGRSGRYMAAGLSTLGLTREDVHWTNAVLCDCPDPRKMKDARKACAQRLRDEITESGVPIVMPVGAWALQSVLGRSKKPAIRKWRGTISRVAVAGGASGGSRGSGAHLLVMPTLHPAFVMRAPGWREVFEADFARLGRVMREGFTAPEEHPDRRIIIARDEDTLADALRGLEDVVGDDVETVGLGPTQTDLVCLALADTKTAVVVPWSRGSDGQVPFWAHSKKIAGLLTETLSSRVAVTHNGPCFDHIVQARYGIHVRRWEDTLLATHAVRSHLPKGLAFVVSMYLDTGPWKEWEHSKAIEDLWVYNARDTLYTVLAWHQLQRDMK